MEVNSIIQYVRIDGDKKSFWAIETHRWIDNFLQPEQFL